MLLEEFDAEKYERTLRSEGREEGREEGRIIGKVEDILELLEELGKIPQWIATRIGQETDPEQLRKWHKCAAKASDMAEFEALFSRL